MKKFLSIVIVLCTLMLTCVGCSSKSSSSAAVIDQSATGKNATGNLEVWSWNYECGNFDGETDNEKIVAKWQNYFKKYYPKITPKFVFVASSDYYTKLKVALSAGSGPDVIGLAGQANLTQFKPFLKTLTTYAQRDWGDKWKDNFEEGSFTQLDAVSDEPIGMPVCLTYAGTVFYSQKILDKYNLKAPTNWDELENTAKVLRENNALPLVTGAKDNWTNEDMFMTLAAEINSDTLYNAIDGKAKWTDPSIVKAFTYFQKLFSDKIFQDGALGVNMYNEAYSLWDDSDGNCKAAMQPNGSWAINAFAGGSKNYDTFASWNRNVMLFPTIEGNEGKLLSTPDAIWCITSSSKNPEAAWDYIKWATSEEGQQATVDNFAGIAVWKGISPKAEMSDALKTVYEKYQGWIKDGKVAGYRSIPYSDLNDALDTNLQLLATSKETPEKAAEAMQTASDSQTRD